MEEDGWSLVMPFELCRSQGGPYDDKAFVSGWRLGTIDAALTVSAPRDDRDTVSTVVPCEELHQLDLIAMRHGFTVRQIPVITHDEEGRPRHDWHKVTMLRLAEEEVVGVPAEFGS
jgi:hypothetical protein